MPRWLLVPMALLISSGSGGARADVRLDRVRRLDGGQAVRYRQTWRGLDVLGGSIFVRFDDRGLVRWSAGAAREIPAELDDQPLVDPADAVEALGRGPFDPEDTTRLVVWAPPGRPARLAWEVRLPRDLGRMETLRGLIDAHTGQLLSVENLVKHIKQARVFPSNPTASTLTTVRLDLPDGATRLAGDDIVALNCLDRNSCPLHVNSTDNARWCVTEPVALADGNGDFLYDRPGSDTALEDEFAEVQMYYHATAGLERFRSFGFTRLSPSPMQAIVNLRIPAGVVAICKGDTSTLALKPHENAFFAPRGAFIPRVFPLQDAIVFGQGAKVDYSYDGDVIVHELTHAVVSTLTDMGTDDIDAHGLNPTMFGMHEGFADYFAAALAGDPNIGEYVGPAITGEAGPLRKLTNDHVCPKHLIGEEHYDSEIWSAALWQIRAGLPESDQQKFDKAVFTVIDALGETESFQTVQADIVAEVETTMGASAAATARAAFAARGVSSCEDRAVPLALGETKQVLLLKGPNDIPVDRVPGPVQLKLTLGKHAKELRLTIDASGSAEESGDNDPTVTLLVKAGAPVVWNGAASTDDSRFSGAVTFTKTDPRKGTAVVKGDFPPGTYYALFANEGTSWFVARFRLSTDAEGPEADKDDGCAAAPGGGRGGAGWVILAGLLALPAARRARRRRGPPAPRRSPRA